MNFEVHARFSRWSTVNALSVMLHSGQTVIPASARFLSVREWTRTQTFVHLRTRTWIRSN